MIIDESKISNAMGVLMSEEKIKQIEAIISLLPEKHTGTSSNHSLTQGDMRLIVDVFSAMMERIPCSGGLTPEEFDKIKLLSKAVNRGLAIIGAAVVVGACGLFWLIFRKGIWAVLKG